MDSASSSSVHAPALQALTAADDWAGLVRYWVAHQREEALDRAINLVRARQENAGPWGLVADFLEDVRRHPIVPWRSAPNLNDLPWPETERLTVSLVGLYAPAALCELAAETPLDRRERLLLLGVESADRAYHLAEQLGDPACGAHFLMLMAAGAEQLGRLDSARIWYQEALDLYFDLSRAQPVLFQPSTALALHNLGNTQFRLAEWEAARDS